MADKTIAISLTKAIEDLKNPEILKQLKDKQDEEVAKFVAENKHAVDAWRKDLTANMNRTDEDILFNGGGSTYFSSRVSCKRWFDKAQDFRAALELRDPAQPVVIETSDENYQLLLLIGKLKSPFIES